MIAARDFSTNAASSRLESEEEEEHNYHEVDVLSPELTHNFDTLRSLLSEATKDEEDSATTDKTNSSGNKRKTAESLAIETALLVEREVAHLQNGIRELEALLINTSSSQPQATLHRANERRRRRRRIDASALALEQENLDQDNSIMD
jgi:hypothetical protein